MFTIFEVYNVSLKCLCCGIISSQKLFALCKRTLCFNDNIFFGSYYKERYLYFSKRRRREVVVVVCKMNKVCRYYAAVYYCTTVVVVVA